MMDDPPLVYLAQSYHINKLQSTKSTLNFRNQQLHFAWNGCKTRRKQGKARGRWFCFSAREKQNHRPLAFQQLHKKLR